MAYYQTQPLVPNAYYVDIIGGSSAGNSGGVSATSILQAGLSNLETVVNPTTQTVSANFLTAYTAGQDITLGAPMALSNNVTLQTLYSPLGSGAGLRRPPKWQRGGRANDNEHRGDTLYEQHDGISSADGGGGGLCVDIPHTGPRQGRYRTGEASAAYYGRWADGPWDDESRGATACSG